jgi:WD40 repeat protein
LGNFTAGLKSVVPSSRANVFAVGDAAGGISLFDIAAGAFLGSLENRDQKSVRMAFDQAGRILASGDDAGRVFLWRDRSFWKEVDLPRLSDDPLRSLALASDGKRGAVGTKGGKILVWDVAEKGGSILPQRADQAVSALAFVPYGSDLVSAVGGRLTLWDTLKHLKLDEEEAHDETITSLAFRPDSSLLASSSLDGTVRLWQVGEKFKPLGGALPVPATSALAWSPNGRVIAVGGINGTITLLDTDQRRLIGTGLPGSKRIDGLAFRDDGHLVSFSGTQILEWDLRYDSWRSYACSLVNRSLTRAEWRKYLAGREYRRTCEN